MTQQNNGWWMQPPNYGVGASGQFNQTNSSMQPQQGVGGDQQAIIQRLMQLGASPQQIAQLGPQLMQLAQRGGLNTIDWGGAVRAAIMPQSQTQAPFTGYGAWNIQTPQNGQGGLQPWMMPPRQGAPLGPAQGSGGFQTPFQMSDGSGAGYGQNGGPWWTDPYGDQSFSGFDPNQILPWAGNTYNLNGPSPFAGTPAGAWAGIAQNMAALYPWQQSQVQQGQWQQEFGANQAQQGVSNNQWNQTFGANENQRAFANQLARDQYNTGNSQWDRNFNAQQGQQGWQNNFTQNEANRAADQWGQQFGANQAQNAWNNQFQTGRANAADSQWGQQFDRSGQQWNSEFERNKALDQWNQAFSQAGFDWQKQNATEQNRLQDQGQNLAAFGRRFGPNVSYM